MSLKNKNAWPYLAIIALSAALIATNVVATPSDGFDNGMPGRLEDRLTDIQIQIDDFRNYVEGSSSDALDISSAICFTGSLGGGVDLGLGVGGDLHAGIGTGVDLYGLLDIDAGVGIKAALDLGAALNVGLEGSVQFCLNAGLLKIDSQGNVQGPGGVQIGSIRSAQSLGGDVADELVGLTQEATDVALGIYEQVPELLDTFDIRPGVVLSSFQSVGELVGRDFETAVTDSLNPANWNEIVAGLPGGDYISGQVDAVYASFSQLGDGNVCGFLDGLGGTIDPGVGNVLGTICGAIPDGVNTSIDAISDVVGKAYDAFNVTIGTISTTVTTISTGVTNVYNYLIQTVQPAISAVKSVVDSIKNIVDI